MTSKWSKFLSPLLLSNSAFLHSNNNDVHNLNFNSHLTQNIDFHPPFYCLPLSCNCTYLSVNNDGILTGIEIAVGQYPNNTTSSLSKFDEKDSTGLALSIKVGKYYYNGENFSLIFSTALRQRFAIRSFHPHSVHFYSSLYSIVL
jgi:hypothetical protein